MTISIKVTNERIEKQPQFDVFELKVAFISGYERVFYFETYKKEELHNCLALVIESQKLSRELDVDLLLIHLESEFADPNFQQNLYDLSHYLRITHVLDYSLIYWNMWRIPYKVEVIDHA